ncbi:MAG: DMT family transporter [Rickettsiales bacterium]
MTLLAFIGMCLAWGFSWIAMKFQVQSFLPPEISLLYRFLPVSLIMFFLCVITKKRILPFKTEYKYFLSIAFCNFFLNFIIGYHASKFIPSGMIAVIFSLTIITSEIFKAIFDGKKIQKKIIISSSIGTIGLIFFIGPFLQFDNSPNSQKILGFILGIFMMIVFSFGNFLVEKNRNQNHTPLFTAIAFYSGFSSIFLLILNLILQHNFEFDYSPKFVYSLLYQIFFSSIIAFLCLYYLIQKIGTVRANYTALIYPTIALIVSSFLENFTFTIFGTFGLILIIVAISIEFVNKNSLNKILKNVFKN